jgi:hypothetical protein
MQFEFFEGMQNVESTHVSVQKLIYIYKIGRNHLICILVKLSINRLGKMMQYGTTWKTMVDQDNSKQ